MQNTRNEIEMHDAQVCRFLTVSNDMNSRSEVQTVKIFLITDVSHHGSS